MLSICTAYLCTPNGVVDWAVLTVAAESALYISACMIGNDRIDPVSSAALPLLLYDIHARWKA
jgi:hypothetical protein